MAVELIRKLVALAVLTAAPIGEAVANPAGITYMVHIRTSYGMPFKDCFVFDTGNTLTIGGLPPITYNSSGFGPGKNSLFEAVTSAAAAAAIGDSFSFTGYGFTYGKKGNTGYIKAIGLSGSNNKFIINGLPDPACTVPAKTLASNPFFPPQ